MNKPLTLVGEDIKLVLTEIHNGDINRDIVPAYKFSIRNLNNVEVGRTDLRVGYNQKIYYGGNIGYSVYEEFRGNKYAYKACKLLFEYAKRFDMKYITISCNIDNIASYKTLELLGGELIEVPKLPEDNDMRIESGYDFVRIYRFEL